MKTLEAVFLAGAALVVALPVLAGRDESQMMLVRQAIEKKKAENLARPQQARAGLAEATGVSGNPGPGTQPAKAGRDSTTHP